MAVPSKQSAQDPAGSPLVCMYLFLDASGGTIPPHPSPRTASPLRYLECALVQAASLRLQEARCELLLVTNVSGGPGRAGRRMWGALRDLGVEIGEVPMRIGAGTPAAATRLPRAALRAATASLAADRELWLPNLDCVWIDPSLALSACPQGGRIGALAIPYPPDWTVGGPEAIGATREALGRTASGLGAGAGPAPRWIGADLLAGTVGALLDLTSTCDALEGELAGRGATATNEQLLTLAAALGRAELEDLSGVARRIQTGARHGAGAPADAERLGIWHLPAEKGLSLRRTARALAHGRTSRLRADLASPEGAMRRFNVGPARRARQLSDDVWVARSRLAGARAGRAAVTLPASEEGVEGRMD